MLVDLEHACRGRTATDIDDLQTYLTTGAGGLLDIIRKMRVVLETHCRTTYPGSFLANDWLGDMVRKMREDAVTDGGDPERIVANAPMTEDHYFVVPKVVE